MKHLKVNLSILMFHYDYIDNNVRKISFSHTGNEKMKSSLVIVRNHVIMFDKYSLTDNSELLKRRLKALEDSKEQLDESLKQQIAYYRTLEREMYRLKSEIGLLVRQKDRHSLYVFCFSRSKIPFFFKTYLTHLLGFTLQMVKKEWNEAEQRGGGLCSPFRRENVALFARFSSRCRSCSKRPAGRYFSRPPIENGPVRTFHSVSTFILYKWRFESRIRVDNYRYQEIYEIKTWIHTDKSRT